MSIFEIWILSISCASLIGVIVGFSKLEKLMKDTEEKKEELSHELSATKAEIKSEINVIRVDIRNINEKLHSIDSNIRNIEKSFAEKSS